MARRDGMAPFWAMPSTILSGTAAAAVVGSINCVGNLGGFVGPYAVGYLTESMHGAGSPQAQRVQIMRLMNLEEKKQLAKKLAGVTEEPPPRPSGAT